MSRRLIAAALVVAAIGTVTVVSSSGGFAATPRASATSTADHHARSFAVFARDREPRDDVPSWLAAGIPNDMPSHRDLKFDESRLVATNGDDRVYLVPKGDRDVCMLGEFADHTSSMACAGWQSASDPATPLVAMTARRSGVRTFGVLADQTTDVRLVKPSGVASVGSTATRRSAASTGGAFIDVGSEFPKELDWGTPEGTKSMKFALPDEPL
jgi:hypothetical protein